MSRTVVVHGHFYQPPRENPWTEEVPREPGAAPFHDWNSRIAAECYRPNAFARILDERGRVVDIVNNYERISFDFGPTLTSWLKTSAPETYERVRRGDEVGGGAIAQTYFHVILPLAGEREVRTEIRWGLAEFRHRFGREAEGIWLPETAVDEAVMKVLAEEGVGFTVLAPRQASRIRPLDGSGEWTDTDEHHLDPARPYRWVHPEDPDLGVDVAFYHGPLSHTIAFELPGLSSEALVDRIEAAAPDDGFVVLAADGETFGHHHPYGDRLIAYALAVEAPKRGLSVGTVARVLDHPPLHQVEVKLSAWSCAHGVGRWAEDCGCSTEGRPGWNQAWRGPLRAALDLVAAAADEVFDRRGPTVFHDAWAARDCYVEVLIGATSRDDFAARHVQGDEVEAFTLLEAQRHRMAMFTSCGWFFNDLAGLEAVQVLRYAARALDCLAEIGEAPPLEAFLATLSEARSNLAEEGDGRAVWERHVVPARVGAERVVAHLALAELLDKRRPASRVAAFDVDVLHQDHFDRGAIALNLGRLALTHRRTGRRTEHVYATLHLGGLEVLGATRPPAGDGDSAAFAALAGAFEGGASVARLLRLLGEGFGPDEFDLTSALPDAGEALVRTTSHALADRFGAAFDRLYSDHRSTIVALTAAGAELPRELRTVTEIALARRLEAEVARHADSLDPADHERARATAREARDAGVSLDTPGARATFESLLQAVALRAASDDRAAEEACAALALADRLGLDLSLDGVQEAVWNAIREQAAPSPSLSRLATALGIAPA